MHTPSKEASMKTLRIFRIVSLLAVAVAVALRTLNLFLFYEADIGYYRAGSILPILLRVLLILSVVAFAVLPLMMRRRIHPASPNMLLTVVAILVATAFAATALWRYCISATMFSVRTVFFFAAGGLASYFFMLFVSKKRAPLLSVITGLGAILWLVSILGASYFDVTVAMNAPEKLVLHLACAGGMLLLLGEIRLACGVSKPRFYLFSLATATLALCVSAIPSCIAALAGILEPRALGYADIVCLALGIFGIARLCSAFRYEEDEIADTVAPEADENAEDLT